MPGRSLGRVRRSENYRAITITFYIYFSRVEPMMVGVPSAASEAQESALKQCRVNLQDLATALEKYRRDHNNTYPPKLDALKPTYLEELPICDAADNEDSYGPSYRTSGNSYRLCCSGHHHKELRYNQPYVVNSSGVPQVLPNAPWAGGSGTPASAFSQLNTSINENNFENVSKVLSEHPELRQQTYQGVPALTHSLGSAIDIFAKKKGDIQTVAALISAGANVNGKMPDGKPAFYHAIAVGDEPLIAFMLEQRANPNLPDKLGNMALGNLFKLAASYDREKMIRVTELLLKHGAEPNARQGFGASPVGIAENYKLTEIVKILKAAGGR